ncbi:MAG: NAD-binding protein, partial [Clostridia bacterium]|nr:NAD-binding protein [Clostridia bacterium]
RDPEYSKDVPFLKDELGLAMVINPEYVAAKEISRVLRFPSALKIETFANGRVELMKFRIPEGSALIDMAVKEVITKLHCDILVCTVERGTEAYIANGNFVFKEKDILSIIASPKNANEFFRKINYKADSVKDAIIIGAGAVSQYLCDIMKKSGISLKVIEKHPDACEEFSALNPDVNVINGDASDNEMMLEEGLATTDAYIALSQRDEENILNSLSAKNTAKCKLITMVTKHESAELVSHLDLDTIINPKTVTSDMIIRYVRATKNSLGSNVETLYNFIPGKIQASEFKVVENSPITDIPLSKLTFKNTILIASILRGDNVIIPRGHDVILPGDSVIVVSEIMPLHDIADILK